MRLHDGRIIKINETFINLELGTSANLLLQALTGCDTVSYPYGKGNITAANLLLKMNRNLEQMCDNQTPNEMIDRGWHRLFGMFIRRQARE